MDNILDVSGLHKSYKNFSLKNLNFSLPEGCITGFIGVNGAGKTTTIKAILNLVQKDAGTICAFGKDMKAYETELKNRMGIVFDESCFYDELSMREMKSIIAPAYSKWNEKVYKSYMERFSLDPRQKISTLSKGMRMKFALVLALSHEAELLIMDEPTSGLDPLIRSQLLEIMQDYMKEGGKGVFFSTHITSDLDKVADMLILIDDGEILFVEEKDTLLENHRLVRGDKNLLNEQTIQFFLKVELTDYGFSGITNRLADVQKSMEDIIVEKPDVEDVMLAYIKGAKK